MIKFCFSRQSFSAFSIDPPACFELSVYTSKDLLRFSPIDSLAAIKTWPASSYLVKEFQLIFRLFKGFCSYKNHSLSFLDRFSTRYTPGIEDWAM